MSIIPRIARRVYDDILCGKPDEHPGPSSTEYPQWDKKILENGFKLRVLSLNVWALPIAPKCMKRMSALCDALDGPWDIVSLQEVWHKRERNVLIHAALTHGYMYYHYFKHGVGFPIPMGTGAFGTGMLIFSRFPIVDVMYHRFSVSGRIFALHEADYLAAKGCGLARIRTPAGTIDFYSTHLLANYNRCGTPGPGDWYLPQRVAQAYEMIQFIEATTKNDLVILAGDFNSPADCLCLRLPLLVSKLRDAFQESNSSEGLTFGTEDNMYSHGEFPMRMDYILFKTTKNKGTGDSSSFVGWNVTNSEVFKHFVRDPSGETYPLSDHFGVSAEFLYRLPNEEKLLNVDQNEYDGGIGGDTQRNGLIDANSDMELQWKVLPLNGTSRSSHENVAIYVSSPSQAPLEVLQEVYQVVLTGIEDSEERRQSHHRRATVSLVLIVFLIISYFELGWVNFSVLSIPFLFLYMILEYLMAQFSTLEEHAAFTEVASHVRVHMYSVEKGFIEPCPSTPYIDKNCSIHNSYKDHKVRSSITD